MLQLHRDKSQPRQGQIIALTIDQKIDQVKYLLKIIEYGTPYNLINTIFGYTLANAHIPLNDKTAFQLKQKFNNINQLYLDRLLSAESVALIVLDAIENKKISNFPQRERIDRFYKTLNYNMEETIMNSNFIYEKWRNQKRIQEENHKNELALRQLLENQRKETKMKAEQAESQGWQCPVCCSEIDRNDFGILECGHIFHPECINGFLKTKIEANEIDICCPMQGCSKLLDVGDIFRYIDGDLKQKFQKFSFNKFVQQNNTSTSWCPTAGCPAVFSFDQELDNYRCPACKKHYCLRCKCQYHSGMTCAEYRVNNTFNKGDEDFIKFVQGAKFKQCPKCKYWVERNDGCCTMTCKCGQQFCYDCGGTACPHGSCSNSGGVVRPAVRPPPPRNNGLRNMFAGRKK